MWVLMLNDMRSSKAEILEAVAKAETKEQLEAFIERERVEPYSDPIENPREDTAYAAFPKSWGKTFRKGGPLEWYNPPFRSYIERHFIDVSASFAHIPTV